MDDNQLVGVVTEEIIIDFAYGKPGCMTMTVRDAMQKSVSRVGKEMPMDQLVDRLHAVPYTAVMDGDRFLGLITRSDVLNFLRKQLREEKTSECQQ